MASRGPVKGTLRSAVVHAAPAEPLSEGAPISELLYRAPAICYSG